MHLQTTVTRVLITTTIALSFALASTSTLAHAETKSVPIACQELQADVETWTKKLKEAESSHDQLSKTDTPRTRSNVTLSEVSNTFKSAFHLPLSISTSSYPQPFLCS